MFIVFCFLILNKIKIEVKDLKMFNLMYEKYISKYNNISRSVSFEYIKGHKTSN